MRRTGHRAGWCLAGGFLFLLVAGGTGCERPGGPNPGDGAVIRIGTKNFTEQFIIGEIMAQLIEAKTPFRVERRFNLGGTLICHSALVDGRIDLYPEYTGTALTAILKRKAEKRNDVYRTVADVYEKRFGLRWLEPFGLNNSYVLAVRDEDVRKRHWKTIRRLARDAASLRAGFTAEFTERPDGYPGLRDAYGLAFAEIREMDPGLLYKALAEGEVDVISGFATDGRIPAYGLASVEDDKGFFPPYEAAPVARHIIIERHPEVGKVLGQLGGSIGNEEMREMNRRVDEEKRTPAAVARDFLLRKGFLAGGSRGQTGGGPAAQEQHTVEKNDAIDH